MPLQVREQIDAKVAEWREEGKEGPECQYVTEFGRAALRMVVLCLLCSVAGFLVVVVVVVVV